MIYPRRHSRALFEQASISLFLGLGVFLAAVVAFTAGYQLRYLNRVFPGVSAAGIALGGLTQEEAAARLAQQLTYPLNGRLLLFAEQQSDVVAPAAIGLILDPEASAENSLQVGRQGGLFYRLRQQYNARFYGQGISPVFIFDQRMAHRFLDQIARQLDRPVIEPQLRIDGVEVVVLPGQMGRYVDKEATLALLSAQVQSLQDGAVPLVIREERPVISDVSGQAELARRILSAPLSLSLPEDQPDPSGPWVFEPPQLANMLTFERVQEGGEARYELGLNDRELGAYLYALSDSLAVDPENTRFIFNDDTRRLEVIQPAITGRTLDVEASLRAIDEKLMAGEHTIPLQFTFTPPPVTDERTGEELGITELVHAETSYFFGSSPDRVNNIRIAARSFHGLLVPPRSTFSMASALDDISLDNGYAEALIIVGDRTVQGVGGGICQVSTTLFRTAFFGGFPIVERHAHAYRVYYYEKDAAGHNNPRLAGLDATVFVPLVDFKFSNDTDHWLLMETYVGDTAITWKFYSTSDGRTVEWNTTGPTNTIGPPKPLYKENPEFAKGEVKQVDWAAQGADVSVNRTVRRDGQVYLQDTFFTRFQPWRAMYEYGPGTEGMPPEPEDSSE